MITWTEETFVTFNQRWCAGDTEYLKSVFRDDTEYHLNTGQDLVGIDAVLGFNAYLISLGATPPPESVEFSAGKDSMQAVFLATIIANNDMDELFGVKDVKKGDKCESTISAVVFSFLHTPLIWSIRWMRMARLKKPTLSWGRLNALLLNYLESLVYISGRY